MDVSRYSVECQKVIYESLKLAKTLGQREAEVEHVVICILARFRVLSDGELQERLKAKLLEEAGDWPRVFGVAKISLGRRLNSILASQEAKSPGKIEVLDLWGGLAGSSKAVAEHLSRERSELKKSRDFEPLVPDLPQQSNSNREITLTKAQEASLSKYTIDLSQLAEEGSFDAVLGRDVELRRVLEILGRKKKSNPLLVGDAGVGKSAIAELLATRISSGDVPESMQGKRVLSLDLGALLSGAKYRGEFEERLKSVLDSLVAVRGQVIIFIDEIHMLIGAGNSEGGADAANLLKPALARGGLQCLGATTMAEYRKYFRKDSALDRRFQPISVEEPSRESSLNILRGLKERYEIHHGVSIADSALKAAVGLSTRYIAERKLPDKAIDLLDEACAKVRMNLDSTPGEIELLRGRVGELNMERAVLEHGQGSIRDKAKVDVKISRLDADLRKLEVVWQQHKELVNNLSNLGGQKEELLGLGVDVKKQGDFQLAAQLTVEELPKLAEEVKFLEEKIALLETEFPFLARRVDEQAVAEVLGQWVGVPVGRLLAEDKDILNSLGSRLRQHVFGQDKAIESVVRSVQKARLGINDPSKPTAVLLFMGPTGVGKTETAKAMATELLGSEDRLIRFDMSEYAEAHNVSRLIGAPPGYVGFGEGGGLTEALRKHPYSIVLFDEVEKAHSSVYDVFLQIFDDGRLTDGEGKVVDCKHSTFILTSNIAVTSGGGREAVRDSLTSYFRPELVNRIDEVIVFDQLSYKDYLRLLAKLLSQLNHQLLDRDFRVSLSDEFLNSIITSALDSSYAGRALHRAFNARVLSRVSDRLLEASHSPGAWVLGEDENGKAVWQLEDEPGKYLPAGKTS